MFSRNISESWFKKLFLYRPFLLLPLDIVIVPEDKLLKLSMKIAVNVS